MKDGWANGADPDTIAHLHSLLRSACPYLGEKLFVRWFSDIDATDIYEYRMNEEYQNDLDNLIICYCSGRTS